MYWVLRRLTFSLLSSYTTLLDFRPFSYAPIILFDISVFELSEDTRYIILHRYLFYSIIIL